jgi:hypothetical protein
VTEGIGCAIESGNLLLPFGDGMEIEWERDLR